MNGTDGNAFRSYPYPSVSALPDGFKDQDGQMVLDENFTFDTTGIDFNGSGAVTRFFHDKQLATLIHHYAAGENSAETVDVSYPTETILRDGIIELLTKAHKESGVDKIDYIKLMEKLATNFEKLPTGLVPRAKETATLFRSIAAYILPETGLSTIPVLPPLTFTSTLATFAVGNAPRFDFNTNDSEIDHIECEYKGNSLEKNVRYEVTDTSLTVTGLADISNEAKVNAMAAIQTSDTTTVKMAKTARAGKGDYTLVVVLDDATKIILTAKAE
jgi:hypothetical protein